jgi:outer membrane cobalamin receptor
MTRFLFACLLVSVVGFEPQALPAAEPGERVAGIVLDSHRHPLPRAPVSLWDPVGAELKRTLTDPQGRFSFLGLIQPTYQLRVDVVGFEPLIQSVSRGAEVELLLLVSPIREEVVVTATRTEAPTGQLGASTSVVDKTEIAARSILPVSDVLRTTPAASVTQSGGLGSTTSLFVRGGESDYNKVMLDGIPLNDPGGFFDFSNLMTENIERVEVVRGPQSALFGSDAMTSVVQLFTQRGQRETRWPRFTLGAEGGNNDTWRTRAGVSGEVRPFDYTFDWAQLATDNREPNNWFHDTSLSSNLGLQLNQKTSLRLVLRSELGHVGTPGQTAFGRPDSDASLRRGDLAVGLSLRHQTSRFWEQRLGTTFQQSRQVSRNLLIDPPFTPSFQGQAAPFAFLDFPFDFLNYTRRYHLSYQSDWQVGSAGRRAGQHVFTFAFEWDRERGFLGDRLSPGSEVEAERDNFGWVFQHQALWGRLYLTNGVRIEDNQSFGTALVPRTSLAYFLRSGDGTVGSTKLKFNFGLGIKEPSLLESFSPGPIAIGNPDLAPERVRSFDVGVEQRFWYERAKLEVNWFDNRFRDLIGFEITSFAPFSGSFFNLSRTKAKGLEAMLELAPLKGLRGRGSYTFLDSQVTQSGTVFDPVLEEGNRLLRRPKHSGALEVLWDWRRLTVASTTLFVGRRTDSDFALLGLSSSEGYVRWDVAWSYRTTYRVTYFAVVQNLLNQDYMEVLGFPALKLNFRAGGRVEF